MRDECGHNTQPSPLPAGCGFFIGDGAGVGKGRQISGIVIDNYVRGRRKAVWVSTSTDLCADATRDLRDLGCHVKVIHNLQVREAFCCFFSFCSSPCSPANRPSHLA